MEDRKANDFGRKFYDALRVHIEQGIKVKYLNLNEKQRTWIDILDDLYDHIRHNPKMDVYEYMRNKYDITGCTALWRMNRALNFIVGMMHNGQRDMQRFKANMYADRMLSIGDATGDWKPIDKAIGHLIKINALDQPDPPESLEDQIPKMGYLLTTDARDVKSGAKVYTPEQRAALFKRYGVEPDRWQQVINEGKGTIDDYDENGNLIRLGRPSLQDKAEEATYEEMEAQWEKEFPLDEETKR